MTKFIEPKKEWLSNIVEESPQRKNVYPLRLKEVIIQTNCAIYPCYANNTTSISRNRASILFPKISFYQYEFTECVGFMTTKLIILRGCYPMLNIVGIRKEILVTTPNPELFYFFLYNWK